MELNRDFLSDVLGFEVFDITFHDCEQIEFVINKLSDNVAEFYINKYELMHLIKLWLANHDMWWECAFFDHKLGNYYCCIHDINKIFIGDSEFEAVYKAGLYVWEINNERN